MKPDRHAHHELGRYRFLDRGTPVADSLWAYDATRRLFRLTNTLTGLTLTAPTIADFTNAAHDHGDTDDGGAIVAAAIPATVLTSGFYSPTISVGANIDGVPSVAEAQYCRVSSVVTVSGRFTADPTTTATATSVELSLPIASDLTTAEQLSGTAFCGAIASMGAEVVGSVANNRAVIQWVASDVTNKTWSYIYAYIIA